MEFHIDRRVVFNQDTEFKNLYNWCLQELDADGKKIGRDQIPWSWSLYFTASELALSDTLALNREYEPDTEDKKTAANLRQVIRATLKPGHPNDRWSRRTTYSMFGTHRTISSFELYIEQLKDGDDQERCQVWGGVSYTTEVDFRDETSDDSVVFFLYVRPKPSRDMRSWSQRRPSTR